MGRSDVDCTAALRDWFVSQCFLSISPIDYRDYCAHEYQILYDLPMPFLILRSSELEPLRRSVRKIDNVTRTRPRVYIVINYVRLTKLCKKSMTHTPILKVS